ncbi:MAG: molybdenum cofactor guanylyltransferase MobA [Alphaproteobacteria bacterium]|nr:molybdenum cofactor guanylyltransferase MobA [Alphaproteobacteria bacterium]
MSDHADASQLGPVAGVLLAGGQSRRMGGGDKCLRPLGGQPILARIIETVAPQVSRLVINANGDPERFASFGVPVAADTVDGYAGPLAGVLTGMEWVAANAPECDWIATFATDAPFLPDDLVERLCEAVSNGTADMACALSNGRRHPVFGLWPVALSAELRRELVVRGVRKVDDWTDGYNRREVEFAVDAIDPFFNVNRPEDLVAAESYLAD